MAAVMVMRALGALRLLLQRRQRLLRLADIADCKASPIWPMACANGLLPWLDCDWVSWHRRSARRLGCRIAAR